MLVVRKAVSTDLARLQNLADQILVGEETQLRVTRSGFALTYVPLKNAAWRSFPPLCGPMDEAFLQGSENLLLAAYLDESCAGLCAARITPMGWCELVDLRVDAVCRRQGAARALLSAVESFAQKRGASGLCMTVPDSNAVICQFLEHNGFRLHGVDNLLFTCLPSEKRKPLNLRSCALTFYKSL